MMVDSFFGIYGGLHQQQQQQQKAACVHPSTVVEMHKFLHLSQRMQIGLHARDEDKNRIFLVSKKYNDLRCAHQALQEKLWDFQVS